MRCFFLLELQPHARKLLQSYGNVLELDATHRTNQYGFPLFFLSLFDNQKKGRPVGFWITQHENDEQVARALQCLLTAVPGYTGPKVILVDKSLVEINAIRTIFPDAIILLCHVHLERSFKKQSGQIARKTDRKTWRNLMKKLIKSSSSSEWDANLQAIYRSRAYRENESIKSYMRLEILPYKNMIALYKRTGLGCEIPNTTNMAESLFNSFKKNG